MLLNTIEIHTYCYYIRDNAAGVMVRTKVLSEDVSEQVKEQSEGQ